TFRIREGSRVEIESVDFDGNFAFPDDELRKVFYDRAPLLTRRNYYVHAEVQATAQLLNEWIQSNGYLASKVVTINRSFIRQGGAVKLVVYLYEGDQTVVEDVTWTGAEHMDAEELLGHIQVRKGQPLDLFAFSEGVERLKAAYRD